MIQRLLLTDLFGEETANKELLCDVITEINGHLLLPTCFGTIWTVGRVVWTENAIWGLATKLCEASVTLSVL